MLQTIYWILLIMLMIMLLINSITLFVNMRKEYKYNKLLDKLLKKSIEEKNEKGL